MLSIAGNNLANVNSNAFKASRITFSEVLSDTLKRASQPTGSVGGTNPQQMGGGVSISGVSPNMSQGNIISTGNPLDLAIEGEGYFVLSDGQQDVYTRAGAFTVDESATLVDPATGYRVQRLGSVGEAEGFQTAGNSDIHVPYDVAIPARATTEIVASGNLSADASSQAQKQVIASNISYTYNSDTAATEATEIDQLDQFSGGSEPDGQLGAGESGTITISGYQPDGTAFSSGLTFTVDASTTLGELVTHLNNNVLSGATASLVSGQVQIMDDVGGYSKTDVHLSYSGNGALQTPGYFEIETVGGEEVKNMNIAVYDSQGTKHVLTGAFVRTDTADTWDLVLTTVTGDVDEITSDNRRIEGITFDSSDGSYAGLSGGDSATFEIAFGHDPTTPQTIDVELGSVGTFDGLTQFAGNSTAVAREQDGYGAGRLSSVSVNNEGILIGAFSNGIKRDIATVRMGLFQNPAGLDKASNGYVIPSANSGEAIATQAMSGGAGTIHSGSLEKSNTDVATEFVNLIQAQNGFQANARSIRVANEILRELSNLIR
jgi:flagellar hook protein FlgE